MDYILGLDLGETSLGWCVVRTQDDIPCAVENMGVRVFSDGRDAQTHKPLAVARRLARGQRRRHDRYLQRRKHLMTLLVKYGLMPQDIAERKALEKLDPYVLRAKALDEKLPAYELGRALFHINQRRGFKSNRKTDKTQSDAGAMKTAIAGTRARIAESGARTLGEFLYKLNPAGLSTQKKQPVRMKLSVEKNKAVYDLYADRAMYEDEVRRIFAVQGLNENEGAGKEIFDVIFYQRPLKPVELGKCQFEEGEFRAYKAFPVAQKSRALQQINQLRLSDDFKERALSPDEKMTLATYVLRDFSKLDSKKRLLTWAAAKKILNVKKAKFNLEDEKRKGIDATTTAVELSAPDCFGDDWFSLSDAAQNDIVQMLLDTEDEGALIARLKTTYGLDEVAARKVAAVPLEDGTASLSVKALNKIMPYLEAGDLYNEAVVKAGYQFALKCKDKLPDRYETFIDFETGEEFDELPYYGRVLQKQMLGGTHAAEDKGNPEKYYGKINNPSVHIALNQTRRLVNELVKKYGHPDKITVELARDLKQSEKERKEMMKEQAENQKDNERIAKELERLGEKNNYDNRMKYRLWEDLSKDPAKRCCPYCGRQISETMLFSPEIEIEHILPFSRSYSDARTNKTVSCRACNRNKGEHSPWGVFHETPEWNDILARAEEMPAKKWRFTREADASMADAKPLDRMLTDTQYMSKMARQYLCWAAKPSNVSGVPGKLTSKLRHYWGLDELVNKDGAKDRTDHRHHAVDAFVVACTDRGTLQRYATQRSEQTTLPQDRTPHIPFPSFRFADIQKLFDNIVISHKPDEGNAQEAIKHGKTVACLHEATNYGMGGEGKKGYWKLIQRVPVANFETVADLDILIDQSGTAEPIRRLLDGHDKTEHKALIAGYFEKRGMKKVRIYRERNKKVILPFKDKDGKPYRYAVYGSNAYAEIYCPDQGENAGKWQMEIVPNYKAHQKNFIPAWRRQDAHAKLIMRLHIDDMVAYEKDGETVIARVQKMDAAHGVFFQKHSVAKDEKVSAFVGSKMQSFNMRKIKVDILGRVFDPKASKTDVANGQTD